MKFLKKNLYSIVWIAFLFIGLSIAGIFTPMPSLIIRNVERTFVSPPLATAITTAKNLTVGAAITSFRPLVVSGGATPYNYSVSSGTLPSGLVLDTKNGIVTGSPKAIYPTANVVFSVYDANNRVAETSSKVSFTVNAAPTAKADTTVRRLTQVTAKAVTKGHHLTMKASKKSSRSLIAHVAKISSTDIPLTASLNEKVNGKDVNNSAPSTESDIAVNAAMTAKANTTAQSLTVGSAMTITPLIASGGSGLYVYSISSGKLPDGIVFNTKSGTVSGTPTIAQESTDVVFSVNDEKNPNVFSTAKVSFKVSIPALVTSSGTVLAEKSITNDTVTMPADAATGTNDVKVITTTEAVNTPVTSTTSLPTSYQWLTEGTTSIFVCSGTIQSSADLVISETITATGMPIIVYTTK